jgi:hypothetical protein
MTIGKLATSTVLKGARNPELGTAPSRFPSIERALRELAHVPLTEACVSGLCDVCLYGRDVCMIAGRGRQDPQSSVSLAGQKNKSGAIR